MRGAAIGAVLAVIGSILATSATAGDPFEGLALVRLNSGIKAPAFTLPDLSGRPVTVTAEGPATILVFWNTW
ncbi:MAG: hypothetical protein HY216_00575 [Candidatus Rokubacteria bacterium]|nr:hypothetical protein [Candidatus Rokubacteria bacterium]